MSQVAVVERAIVGVAGPEAHTYLQGQLSQELSGLAPGGSVVSFLLDPTGKVVALLRVLRVDDDRYDLLTDPQAGDAVAIRLRRYLLRTKADVLDPAIESCSVVFGGPPLAHAVTATLWPGEGPPQEIIGLDPDVQAAADDIQPVDFERRRIVAGVPVSGVDIGAETIPGEVGAWAIERAVSFTKGCYTGQELVARIDSRGGNVPRPLRGVVAVDGSALHAGSEIVVDGRPAGRLTSAAGSVGIGPIARSVVPPELGTVDGRPVEVQSLPLQP